MSEFRKITADQTEQWERIRTSFSNADVYYMNGYVRGLQAHGDGEPMLVYYEEDGLRLMNVVMKRDISAFPPLQKVCPPATWYDVSTPYGYGGMIAEGEGMTEEAFRRGAEAYARFCAEEHIVAEFVRFYPLIDNAAYGTWFYETERRGPTVALPLHSEEEILKQMKSQCRNKIRLAQKKGISVRFRTDLEALETFREIYEQTMDRDQAEPYYYFEPVVYETWLRCMPGRAVICEAALEDQVIFSAIMLYDKGRMHYHLSGTRTDYLSFFPNNLIIYETAKYALQHGCTQMHLGGGLGAREDGLYQFKKAFNQKGEDKTFYLGKRIYNEEIYGMLTEARGFRSMPSFFPAYRGVEEQT